MALQVRKAEPIGNLMVSRSPVAQNVRVAQAPQQRIVMGQLPQQQIGMGRVQNGGVSVSHTPRNVGTIMGVNRNSPGLTPGVRRPMDNPLQWFADTAVDFGQGVGSILQDIMAAPERLMRSVAGLSTGLNNQDLLTSNKVAGIPGTEKLAEILYGGPIQTYQQSGVDAHRALLEMTGDNALATTGAVFAVPGLALADVAGAGGSAATSKAIKEGIEATIANASRDSVKSKALDHLIRQELVGSKNIPITATGGGNVPVPVRVNKNIPVRYEASDDVLDKRLTTEYNVLLQRHDQAVKEVQALPAEFHPFLMKEINAKFDADTQALFATRDAGTLAQRIPVKEAPKTKLSKTKTAKVPKTPKAEKPAVDAVEQQIYNGKSPNLFTRSWRSVAGVLEKNGTGGKMINRGVQKARDYSEKTTGSLMTDLDKAGFKHIDDDAFARVWDAVEAGSAKGLSTNERRVAAALVRTMRRVHKSAGEAGMDIGDRGSTYLPHWYKENDKDMVNFFKKNFNQRNSNLERKRLTEEEGYEKSKESIARYIQNASERIGRAKEFGQNDEKLAQMFDVAAREGYDLKQLQRYAKTALGDVDYDSTGQKVSGAIRQYEAITSLQKSAAANIGQQVNTITVAGVKNWAKGTYKYWSDPNSKDWAQRTGVFGDHVLGNLQKQYAGTVGDNLTGNKAVRIFKKHFLVPGMQAVEKFNRANSVLAGKAFAEDLISKSAKGDKKAQRLMQTYFPGIKEGDDITDDMITDAARELVKRTQFKVDPVDLPNWTSSAVGKLIFQFRSFGYKQTQFMAREVIGEALRGNFAPMTRFLAIGTPIGYGISEARNAISGTFMNEDKRKEFGEKSVAQRALEGFLQIGGGGLPTSEAMNIKRSVDYADDDNKMLDAATSVLGPAITDARRGLDAASKSLQGEHREGAIFLAQQVPIIGPIVSGLVKDAMKGETDITKMNPDELDKFKKQTYAKFIGGMSDRDKDLMAAVNDDDYARIGIKSGKFTQDQIDDMQAKYNRNLFKAGLPIKYIKGVTDEEFDSFTPELQAMVMEASMIGTKKFAESKTYDKTSESVIKKAMETAWPEIGDIKGSNQMAIDYLQAQRDYVKAGDDEGKQFDIVKAFWNKAVKEQYSSKVRNIYNNSLADIERLLGGITVGGVHYSVSKSDLDAAVALDDRLLAAGLRDTPKFSNKTRAAYGYGEAVLSKIGTGYSGSKSSSGYSRRGSRSGSGGGGGGGGSTANPYSKMVSRGSRSSLSGAASRVSSKGGKAGVKLAGATGGGSAPKPRVSIKKNKV